MARGRKPKYATYDDCRQLLTLVIRRLSRPLAQTALHTGVDAEEALTQLSALPYLSSCDIETRESRHQPCHHDATNLLQHTFTLEGWKEVRRQFARQNYNRKHQITSARIKHDSLGRLKQLSDMEGCSMDDLLDILTQEYQEQKHELMEAFTPEEGQAWLTQDTIVKKMLALLPTPHQHEFKQILRDLFFEGYLACKAVSKKQRSIHTMHEALDASSMGHLLTEESTDTVV